jgi:hypothetical protein
MDASNGHVNPERWQEIKAALDRALEFEGASRRAYVEQITANDSQLRLELESLIAAHEGSADSFMSVPAAAIYPVVETSTRPQLSARITRIGRTRHGSSGVIAPRRCLGCLRGPA